MAKHFLYLTNDKLVTLLWQSGTIIGRDVFLASEAASPEFHAYLAKHREVPTYLVADLIEEDFRLDTIPHLRGGDSEAVISRKLGQLYRASSFRHAIIQGREPEGRRDDKVFYHAVTNADLLKPWLAALEATEVPVEGVFSSPVLSVHLLNQIDAVPAHALLVTIVPDFGLRQTYFQNKQIKFSRLTQIVYDEGQSVGGLIAAETSRTWQYLDSLRFFSNGETLEVCILVHERDRPMIAEAIRSYPLLKYRFLNIAEIASKIKLKPLPTSSHAEEVLTHLYAQNRLENHFAEPALTRFAVFRRARIGLYALTASVLALGAAGATFNLYQASQISQEIEKREVASRGLQGEYQTISNALRQQKLASDTVRDTSIFFNSQIRPQPAGPGAFLRGISGALAAAPNVRLAKIVWEVSNDANTTPTSNQTSNATLATQLTPLQVTSTSKGAQTTTTVLPVQTAPDATYTLPGNKFDVGIIEASVVAADGDFRKMLADIEKFTARVNQIPGVKASAIQLPLDVASTAKLDGRVNQSYADPREAHFVLKIVRTVAGT